MSIKVTILGSGVWLGNRKLDKRGPGFLVEAGGMKILVDCAAGTNYQLARARIDPNAIDAVLITHLHPDHVAGLVPLLGEMYLAGRKKHLEIYGPKNLEKLVRTSEEIYTTCAVRPLRLTAQARTGAGALYKGKKKFAGLTLGRGHFTFSITEELERIKFGNVVVEAHAMAHTRRNSLGYRMSFGRKIVAFTGDTEYCPELLELADGVDILFCECSKMKYVKGHMYPEAIANTVIVARPKKVALIHLYPDCDPSAAARKVERLSGVRTIATRDLQLLKV